MTDSSIKVFTNSVKADFSGFLKKKGKKSGAMKSRYFYLKGNLLYYYDKQSDTLPKDITFMPNKLIKKETIKGKFCVSVFCYDSSYHYKTLYAASEPERDQWFSAMLKASNNDDILQEYKLKETLGVGKFSTVRKGYSIHDESKQVAVKIVSKKSISDIEREYLLNEVSILSTINHPNVPKIYGVHETPDRLCIVMELVKEGELFDHLVEHKTLEENEATKIVYKLLKVLKYLKELKIMHRDIKTENMLISKNRRGYVKKVFLIDFGLAKYVDSREPTTAKLGTLGYCAPEVILKKSYNESVDMFGLGMVYYLLLTGKLPFDSKSNPDIAEKTVKNSLPLDSKIFDEFNSSVPKVLERLCEKDPENRMTVEECLNHPLFIN